MAFEWLPAYWVFATIAALCGVALAASLWVNPIRRSRPEPTMILGRSSLNQMMVHSCLKRADREGRNGNV